MAGIEDVAETNQVYYEYRALRIEYYVDEVEGWQSYATGTADETIKKVIGELRMAGCKVRVIEEKITKTILDW